MQSCLFASFLPSCQIYTWSVCWALVGHRKAWTALQVLKAIFFSMKMILSHMGIVSRLCSLQDSQQASRKPQHSTDACIHMVPSVCGLRLAFSTYTEQTDHQLPLTDYGTEVSQACYRYWSLSSRVQVYNSEHT